MACLEPDAMCACGHVLEEHCGVRGACTAIDAHRTVMGAAADCLCTEFDLDEEVGPRGSWR